MSRGNGGKRFFRLSETRRHREAQVDEELGFLIEELTERFMARGMSQEEARREADRRFRDLDATRTALLSQTERTARLSRRRLFLDGLRHDLRVCLRQFGRRRGFTITAVLTLGLGIGANTAIFSVFHAVLLQPLAYPSEPDRIVVVSENSLNHDEISVSYPNFKDWQAQNRSFDTMAGYRHHRFALAGLEEPIFMKACLVSHEYFRIMGATPLHGRFFTPDEDQPGAPGRVILNYPLWQNQFGGDPAVIGRTLRLEGETYDVIGILPAGFEPAPQECAYITLERWTDNPGTRSRGNHQGLFVIARLRTDVAFAEARSEMEAIAARLETQYPESNTGIGVNVKMFHGRLVEEYRLTLFLLLGAVSLVLLIACTNVAQLLLTRAVGRRREAAIQVALGAGRRRLVQQNLTEGVLLALMGGALGLGLAFAGLELLRDLLPADVPRLDQVQINGAILFYTLAVSILTGILFGALPAVFTSRTRPIDALKEGTRATGSRLGARRGLLVTEVALAVVLVIGAGLLIRSVDELSRVDPGFRTENLLTMQIGLPELEYESVQRSVFIRDMQDGVAALPGVTSVAVGLYFPMMETAWSSIFIVGDQPVPPRSELPSSLFTPVTPGFFRTFDIPLLQGRTFLDSDAADAPAVVVVNRTLAEHIWPGEDPVGKRLKQGWPENDEPWREIVGVVDDIKQQDLDEEIRMQTFLPVAQSPLWSVLLALRTAVDPLSLVEPVRDVISDLDSDIPVYQIMTMDDLISASVMPRRFTMILLSIFAALALVLSAIGLYGVIAYVVAGRRHEIGVRIALGARRQDVFLLVVRQGMAFSLMGVAIGIGAALVLTRLLSSLLYAVGATDPLMFSLVPVVLMIVALIACSVPARAAVHVDPVRTLRSE